MRKRDELNNPAGCMSRARDDEMTFVLLGRDAAAPAAIRAWAEERIRLGKNAAGDPQIVESLECARVMETERSAPPIEPPAESKAKRIASAIHRKTVMEGVPLGRALREVKAEFEGGT